MIIKVEIEGKVYSVSIKDVHSNPVLAEVDGKVYLVPGDYPLSERNAALARHALPISELSANAHAKRLNMIFYGGCRDNPLAE